MIMLLENVLEKDHLDWLGQLQGYIKSLMMIMCILKNLPSKSFGEQHYKIKGYACMRLIPSNQD